MTALDFSAPALEQGRALAEAAGVAIVRIDSTGAITATFGIASHGQGLETTLAQVVAEHLGARFEDIRVLQGDSSGVPGGTGTYASRSMVLPVRGSRRASSIRARATPRNTANTTIEDATNMVATRLS